MDKKDLRKLKRKELLEIMLEQAKRIKELERELDRANKELDNKKIKIKESGSIAEASLKLNNIFSDAQEAIDQYFDNVKESCKKLENSIKKEALDEKKKMLALTEEKCKKREIELEEKYNKLMSGANSYNNVVVKVSPKAKNRTTSKKTTKNEVVKKDK